jgi:hypothetical protein
MTRVFSEEHKRKLSEAHKGKKASLETKQKLSETRKGEKNSFYGKKHTEETRKKLSESHKGQIAWNKGTKGVLKAWNKGLKGIMKPNKTSFQKGLIPWNKGKKCPERSGDKNNKWKGGITSEQEKIRKSPEYKLWRKSVFERDLYTCQKCNKVGGILRAHHIDSFDNNPNKRTLIDNGITFCQECHRNFHHLFGRGNNTKKQLKKFLLLEIIPDNLT